MSRTIIQADSQKWLKTIPDNVIPNVLTGICDLNEINLSLDKYLSFFKNIASSIFQKLSKNGYAIFIQTDRKHNRTWIDKSQILTNIANDKGLKLIWHKIVLLRGVDRTDLHRPTYSHMLCYAYPQMTTGAATPDVIPVSKRLYKNGTPLEAAKRSIEFIKRYTKSKHLIIDPFVGQGTIAVLANNVGMDVIGVDIDPEQCEKAEDAEFDY